MKWIQRVVAAMEPLRGSGSEGSKGSEGSEGGGIAFGDEYKDSVTGFTFLSPLLHDEVL